MQHVSGKPCAAQWSAGPAAIVTRLGGTPRSSTLILGMLLALISGVVIFRAAPGSGSTTIETATELASTLELPVVGNMTALREAAARMRRRVLTPKRVRPIVQGAEITVLIAVCACFVATAFEPSLARQV